MERQTTSAFNEQLKIMLLRKLEFNAVLKNIQLFARVDGIAIQKSSFSP